MTTAPEPKRRGRPPLAPEDRADAIIQVRTTAERKARLQRLAEVAGLSQSAWIEQAIDRSSKG